LLDFPWVLPPESQRWRQVLEETFIAEGLSSPLPSVTSNSANFIRSMLLDNFSLSYLPLQSLAARPRSAPLVPLRVPALEREVEITVTVRERAAISPATHALIAALQAVASGKED
jgi:DNA-binding transcriptional LysR family regulator